MKPRSYRTYSQRFRKKKAIWKLPRGPALLSCVRGEKQKNRIFFFETAKNSFYNTTNKKIPGPPPRDELGCVFKFLGSNLIRCPSEFGLVEAAVI